MLKPKEIAEIALVLWYLPLEKVAEIKRLVRAMKQDYGYEEPTDDSDEWTDEDREDLQREAMRRLDAEDPYPGEEPPSATPSSPIPAGERASTSGENVQEGVAP